MFTILYFLVRMSLHEPVEPNHYPDVIGEIMADPITIVFAVLMIVAIIVTRIKRKDVKRNKLLTGGMTGVALYLPTFGALMTPQILRIPESKISTILVIYLSIAICILSLVFILISINEGRGIVNGLIDMFDFELQGIFWIAFSFVCIAIMLLPFFLLLMIGGGSGSSSDDDDDFWLWYLFFR